MAKRTREPRETRSGTRPREPAPSPVERETPPGRGGVEREAPPSRGDVERESVRGAARARARDEDMAQGEGEGANLNPRAPASSGLVHGSPGEISPEVDNEPQDTLGARPARTGKGETPVPSPTGGAHTGPGRIQTGSAGAASVSAGGAPASEAGEGWEDREVLEPEEEEER